MFGRFQTKVLFSFPSHFASNEYTYPLQAEADCNVQIQSGPIGGVQWISLALKALARAFSLKRLRTSFQNEKDLEHSAQKNSCQTGRANIYAHG